MSPYFNIYRSNISYNMNFEFILKWNAGNYLDLISIFAA